jgi:hypothetical protein
VLQARFGAVGTNPIYHMVQEAVQVHDLGVHVRNFARVAVLGRRAVPREPLAAVARRENVAAEYEKAALELRGRALACLDTMIADPKSKGVDGAVHVARLKTVRAMVNKDPFHRLNADIMEVMYYKLNKTTKDAFWLAGTAKTWLLGTAAYMQMESQVTMSPERYVV